MELRLQNIGMIKEATVKLDGLTVIAGENDTGKSTVGKALFALIESKNIEVENENNIVDKFRKNIVSDILNKIFNYDILLEDPRSLIRYCDFFVKNNNDSLFSAYTSEYDETYCMEKNVIFIESPIVWNFIDFFRDIALIESQKNIRVDYPYLMNDLIFKLQIQNGNGNLNHKENIIKEYKAIGIQERIIKIINGSFVKDEIGSYFFEKNNKKIELANTAMGIKSFGILQILSENNWLNEDTVLILDEPEVHLHPKWQIEMAKIIVELVKNGVKILVNSHSPYMIEALKRYAEKAEIEDKTNFYLAEDGYIKQIEESNSLTLVEIYEKLAEPYDVFEKMDGERMEKLIHG